MLAALLQLSELCYKVLKGTKYCVSLQTSAVLTKEYNVLGNSEELIDTTERVML